MDIIRANIKLRKATIEDFIWLDWEGNKRMKMGFPFYVLIGNELKMRFVRLLKGEEKDEQMNDIKECLGRDSVYVLDPAFLKENRILIDKN